MVPDTWEYPWYAAWDLAFQAVGVARVDPAFAFQQLEALLGDDMRRADGALPAYEFAFSDANPPVHAWACLRADDIARTRGVPGAAFLSRVFEPLRENLEWWMRTWRQSDGAFGGGFLGLDNAGLFDRGAPPPLQAGGRLAQADGTAWMVFFAASLARLADRLARRDPRIGRERDRFRALHAELAQSVATFWDEDEGFFFDQVRGGATVEPLRAKSIIGLVPLLGIARLDSGAPLRPISSDRMRRVMERVLRPDEFLSPFGVRSGSRAHRGAPAVFRDATGREHRFDYAPAESETLHFGANSNWRGPIWIPFQFLLIDALETWAVADEDSDPRSAERWRAAARTIRANVLALFRRDARGRRPCDGDRAGDGETPLRFREYFCGDTGRGLGAAHQGWSALAAELVCAPESRDPPGG
jgi:hypothetical protein